MNLKFSGNENGQKWPSSGPTGLEEISSDFD